MKVFLWLCAIFILTLASIAHISANEGAEVTASDGKIEYKKGSLDIDALTSVIAEKQDQLKSRIVMDIILKYFENTNYTSYLYVSRSLTSLLTVNNKSVMKRELLMNTADYVLVYVFSRLFLVELKNDTLYKSAEELHNKRLKLLSEVFNLSNTFNLHSLPYSIPNRIVRDFLLTGKQDSTIKSDSINYFNDVLMDMAFYVLYNCSFFNKLGFFNETNPVANKYSDFAKGNLFVRDTDGVYCPDNLSNKSLTSAVDRERRKHLLKFDPKQPGIDSVKAFAKQYSGLLKILKIRLIGYDSTFMDPVVNKMILNMQNSLDASSEKKQDIQKLTVSLHDIDTSYCNSLKKLRDRMDTLAETIVGLHGEITAIVQNKDEILRIWKDSVQSDTNVTTQSIIMLTDSLDAIKRGSSFNKNNFPPAIIRNLMDVERLLKRFSKEDNSALKLIDLTTIFSKLCILQRDTSYSTYQFHDFLSNAKEFTEKQIKGSIHVLLKKASDSTINSEKKSKKNQKDELFPNGAITALGTDMLNKFINNLTSEKNIFLKTNADSMVEYLQYLFLLDTLSNSAQNYKRMLKMAEHASDLLANTSAKNAVNTIIASIRRYSTIDANQDKISIDVESMIADLYKRYSDRSNKWVYWSPYFTVGINASVFYRNLSSDSLSSWLPEAKRDSLTNFSFSNVFASEKIGIKWKIWNFKYCASFDEGDDFSYYGKKRTAEEERHDPIMSDIHLIFYASGILYNLVNVKTKKDFSAPLFGCSLGTTFFNGLDLNLGGGLAYQDKNLTSGFLSASFDIDIVEYLNRLSSRLSGK